MRTVRRTALCVSAALTTTLFAACSSGTPTASVTAGDAANAKMTIGISFDQPGLGLKAGNTYSGFDVDTAIYVAKQLGVSSDAIAWREADPADRENLLINGDVDLVFSTYSITPEREKKVSFAGPYFTAHQDLLIRRNDTSITGPDTLDGKKLCSVTGTTSAELIKKKYLGKINLLPLSKFSDCVSALANGNVDAVTTDDVILAGFAAQPQYKGLLKVVGQGFSTENYGVGIKKGDTAMVSKVNAALKKYIDDGSWKTSLESTVGPSGYRIPAPPTPGS